MSKAVSQSSKNPEFPKAPTGIDGLDEVTGGGFPRGRPPLICGGPGAGKTTLISHLSGALAVQSGEILIDGQPLQHVRAKAPTRIAVAPQVILPRHA